MLGGWDIEAVKLAVELAGIIVMSGVMGAIWRYVVQPFRKTVKRINMTLDVVGELGDDAQPIVEQLKRIGSELTTNGGSTLKDAIVRIEQRQVAAERKQMFSDERMRALVMHSSVAVFEADEAGDFVWVNWTYKSLCGLETHQLRGSGWVNSICQDDRDEVLDEWLRSVKYKRDYVGEYEMVHVHTGHRTMVVCRASMLLGLQGETIGWVGIISPRKVVDAEAAPSQDGAGLLPI